MKFYSAGSHLFDISEKLQRYLGFGLKTLIFVTGKQSSGTIAKRSLNAIRGLNLVYFFCDTAACTIVRNINTLLRICNVVGRHGEFVRRV